MRSTPLASPGPLGELFWLLSHPTCASLSAAALGVSLLSGGGFESVWCQALAILTAASGLAQLTTQAAPLRPSLLAWLAGASLLLIGVALQVRAAGLITIPEGGRVESYERGEDVKVEHHIGGTLSLKRIPAAKPGDSPLLSFDLDRAQRTELSERALLSGQQLTLGPWSMSLLELKRDPKSPRAQVTITPRAGGEARSFWLRSGDRSSPDGQLSVAAFDVAGDFSSPHIKKLGAAIDLELSWRAQGGASPGQLLKERAWHFVDIPELNEQAGVSPWVVRVNRVEPSPVYVMKLSQRSSMLWIWLGLALWGASLLLELKRGRAELA